MIMHTLKNTKGHDGGKTAATRLYIYKDGSENNYQCEVRLENSSGNELRRIIVVSYTTDYPENPTSGRKKLN